MLVLGDGEDLHGWRGRKSGGLLGLRNFGKAGHSFLWEGGMCLSQLWPSERLQEVNSRSCDSGLIG